MAFLKKSRVFKTEFQIGAEHAASMSDLYGPIDPLPKDWSQLDDDVLFEMSVNCISDPDISQYIKGYNSQAYLRKVFNGGAGNELRRI